MFPDFFRDDVSRLETSRLWLRWPMASDGAAIQKHAADYEVAQYTARIPHPYTHDAAKDFVSLARSGNAAGHALHLALALKHRPGSLVGVISLVGPKSACYDLEEDAIMLSYWLGRPYWGDGVIGEAVKALLDFIWLASDIAEIRAGVMIENTRSRRVLEKSGFMKTHEGPCQAPARGGLFRSTYFACARPRPRFGHDGVRGAGASLCAQNG